MSLPPDQLAVLAERVAVRVIERLLDGPTVSPLMTAAEVAAWLKIEREWVYEHAVELGALRLGRGPRAPLRFDPRRVEAALACTRNRRSDEAEVPTRARDRRRRVHRATGTEVPLLPIRGREGV